MQNQDLPRGMNDKPGLIPRQVMPENLETPINNILSWITPTEMYYARNHLPYPTIQMQSWALGLGGEVEKPFSFTYEDLKKMPSVSKFVTTECSGNKRAFMEPPVPGEQWRIGAVGNVKWTGVPLTYLLDQAKLKGSAVELIFTGSDSGIRPDMDTPVNYERSLPLDRTLLAECILGLKMNGEPIPHKHGFPLRLIVPGWYGMAHVKWVTRITASSIPFKGPFQAIDYVYITNEGDYHDAVPVTEMKVNSIITWPSKGEKVHLGQHTVRGLAWAGKGTINKVEVSLDNGMTWNSAQLTSSEHEQYTWTLWEYLWDITAPGHYSLLARAFDSYGNVQPKAAPWNAKGYGNNSIHQIKLMVPQILH
ncbi:sulfite oxidase [Desulfosporosinus nitroreducens]|uniref:Sulfite oxidase n=1 Tax=Desulfosporosinus nitroreducens TaxID=2018668 RepID=A0ABT8QQQ0_9FIRM|nr:sulfite oxidase [Desulfosporosinus nitroreducens]MDO0823671.1 sulfite oxidase [Desulfosporosinus nitroreducens]